MPGITVTKRVVFIGAWRTHTVNDQLLRQINNQTAAKKGVYTLITLTANGLELNILDSNGHVSKKDSIPLENIVDLIDNKYNTRCTLAIVRNKQLNLYTVYVFICDSEKDTAALINTFKGAKGQLIGEGYNVGLTPSGKNWTLIPKEDEDGIEGDKGRGAVGSNENHVDVNQKKMSNKGSVTYRDSSTVMDVKRRAVRAVSPPPREQVTQGPIYVKRALSPTRRVYPMRPAEVQYQAVPASSQMLVRQGNAVKSTYAMPVNGQYVRTASISSKDSNAYNRRVNDTRFQAVPSPRVYFQQQPQLQPQLQQQPATSKRSKGFFRKTKKKKVNNSYGRDTVTRNIEEVYRGRSMRRVVVPPPHGNWNPVQYVTLSNGGMSPVKLRNSNPFAEQHVEVRDTYIPHESNPHVEENTYDIVQHRNDEETTGYDHDSNNAERHDSVVVQTSFDERKQPETSGEGNYGNEYEVSAIERTHEQETTSQYVTGVNTEQNEHQERNVHVIKITENDDIKEDHIDDSSEKIENNDGLFESYVETPEPDEENVIKREKAVSYHEDSESEINEDENTVPTRAENGSIETNIENEDQTNEEVETDENNDLEVNNDEVIEVSENNLIKVDNTDVLESNDTDAFEINNDDVAEVNDNKTVEINNADVVEVNDTDGVEVKNADFYKTEDVDEEPYRLDLDALNAYSQIPDIVLVHTERDDDKVATARSAANVQNDDDIANIENENNVFSERAENETSTRSKSSKAVHVSFREDEISNENFSSEGNLGHRNDISWEEDTAVDEPTQNEDSEEEPYQLDVNALNAYSEIPDIVIVKSPENHSERDTERYSFDSGVNDAEKNMDEDDEHPVKKQVDFYYEQNHDEIMQTAESTVLF
ncbi:protein PFC0760c-like [Mya arenaria]|uniref:protein PFC0760c-like n=1 Tax=Mya arenaria TaxID=6604 RepID=UPI0022E0A9CA|nr:protein PFC0760c-like [Mya arenaria]